MHYLKYGCDGVSGLRNFAVTDVRLVPPHFFVAWGNGIWTPVFRDLKINILPFVT